MQTEKLRYAVPFHFEADIQLRLALGRQERENALHANVHVMLQNGRVDKPIEVCWCPCVLCDDRYRNFPEEGETIADK